MRHVLLTDRCRDLPEYDNHVVHGLVLPDNRVAAATFVHRESDGVKTLGGAIVTSGGGLRYKTPNGSDEEAYTDGLRLSGMRGMSGKFSAIFGGSDLMIGGAKTVVFGHNIPEVFGPIAKTPARQEFLRAFGKEMLGRIGTHLTSVDMGTTQADLAYLARHAPPGTVTGHTAGTNPSPITARGLLMALEKTWEWFGDGNLYVQPIALQGAGSVGYEVLKMLCGNGARNIVIAEPDENSLSRALDIEQTIRYVDPHSDAIYRERARIFMPCAKGGILNYHTTEELNMPFRMIVGCANNQLATPEDGARLHESGIAYAVDYIANAGGAIKVLADVTGRSIEDLLRRIPDKLHIVFKQSELLDKAPSAIADKMVAEYIANLHRAR